MKSPLSANHLTILIYKTMNNTQITQEPRYPFVPMLPTASTGRLLRQRASPPRSHLPRSASDDTRHEWTGYLKIMKRGTYFLSLTPIPPSPVHSLQECGTDQRSKDLSVKLRASCWNRGITGAKSSMNTTPPTGLRTGVHHRRSFRQGGGARYQFLPQSCRLLIGQGKGEEVMSPWSIFIGMKRMRVLQAVLRKEEGLILGLIPSQAAQFSSVPVQFQFQFSSVPAQFGSRFQFRFKFQFAPAPAPAPAQFQFSSSSSSVQFSSSSVQFQLQFQLRLSVQFRSVSVQFDNQFQFSSSFVPVQFQFQFSSSSSSSSAQPPVPVQFQFQLSSSSSSSSSSSLLPPADPEEGCPMPCSCHCRRKALNPSVTRMI